jgi:hypothetical protein
MRLLNTSTGAFEEFIGKNIPKYAILSHTWEEEEVSYTAMMSDPSYQKMKGYQKIKMTSEIALQAGYGYVWIDTCCIDKTSSAELTEAINSMYRWYQRAQICYVFLSDLDASASLDDALKRCRWFTRGWTLQELIAPRSIIFFDQQWKSRGTKKDMIGKLSKITGIDTGILSGAQPLATMSVAQKMSWAAKRETTRIEDTAYCLLGIFDVNMPLLYGEEGKAFRRLQEEIVKSTSDLSIFAWKLPVKKSKANSAKHRVFCGLLAESPRFFAESSSFSRLPRQDFQDFSFSNSGIKIQSQILSEPIPGKRAFRYVLPLDCSPDGKMSLGVRLRKCGADRFVREDPWNLVRYSKPLWPNAPRVRYLLAELPRGGFSEDSQTADTKHVIAQTRPHALQIQRPADMEIYDAWPWPSFDDEDQLFFVPAGSVWDAASLRLWTGFTGPKGNKVEFETVFFALGWTSQDVNKLQCTVLDYRKHAGALKDAQTEMTQWNHNRYQVMDTLIHHKIPKASVALFEIPGTKTTAAVSFKPVLVSEPSICPEKFWRIEFACNVYGAKEVPKVEYGEWKISYGAWR